MRIFLILSLLASPFLSAEELTDVPPLTGNPFAGEALKGKDLKNILAAREKAVPVCLTCTDDYCFVDTLKVDSAKLLSACGTLFVKPKKYSRTRFFMASKISNAEIKYSIDKKGRGNVGEIKFECAWDNPEQCSKDKLDAGEKIELRKNIKKVFRNTRWEPLIVDGLPHELGNLMHTLHYGYFPLRAGDVFGLPDDWEPDQESE